ncbi:MULTISPECIES: DUF6480 family protein [Streptomyces]|uniref:DUF6480 family protein n=1 Tax=Streptomyces TaxID=1883 RepID=UPI00017F1A2C|nr:MULTISPECIES: DUF6480 family protein [Streptomyces]AKL69405.1 membrane protein [Streptomyces sp. Mg1]RPK32550.1 hypothetical protein EES37_32980 [Streptomyces sp. ADI91-18]WBY23766.1 DUF6480 family protein [Streptomyces goshikiensis]WSS02673.1 DUF6480 family protein [Streptomyces goshikiensis]WSX96100.1 DUF6480 family protein [Streptomyces goshikiensis]
MSVHIPGSEPVPRESAPRAVGGVPPGETPPGESSTGSGTGPYRPLTRGWGMAPLVAICALAVVCALFFLAYAIVLLV